MFMYFLISVSYFTSLHILQHLIGNRFDDDDNNNDDDDDDELFLVWQISDTPPAGFEPVQNLISGLVE